MTEPSMSDVPRGWHPERPASAWIARFSDRIDADGTVLDVAAGAGRHSQLFLSRGNRVVAVDVDLRGIADLMGNPRLEAHELDLETGGPFPLAGRRFAGVVVTNYLYRPILADLVEAVGPGGWLLYETFSKGNEEFGGPRNPDYLLRRSELLELVRGKLTPVAFEDLEVSEPKPARVQRIAAVREVG